MGPKGLDCRYQRQEFDPGASDRRHTQMAVLKGSIRLHRAAMTLAGNRSDVGRRFTLVAVLWTTRARKCGRHLLE
jgi:hypothetical protein